MSKEKKDWWDKAKIIFEIGAILAVIYYGNMLNSSLKNKEINLQMVKVAIDVLRTEPTENTQALREWAVEIVDRCSAIPFNENIKKSLLKQQLPYVTYGGEKVTYGGDKVTYGRNKMLDN